MFPSRTMAVKFARGGLLVFVLVHVACTQEDVFDHVQFNESEPELANHEGDNDVPNMAAVSTRNHLLELLLGLTGHTEEEEAPDPPAENCQPCPCGTTNKKIRIVGGKPTQVNQYPWMALLMYNGRFYCGGSLINARYVLTAAHCVDGFSKDRMMVRLLEHHRNENDTILIDRKVKRIIRHSGYSDTSFNNDIALLKLDYDVPIEGDMRPVCLPQRGKSFTNDTGLVTGWGVTAQGGSPNVILHEVSVPIMSNTECRNSKYGSRRITDNMLCAGNVTVGMHDACQGDSGGPLHVINTNIHDLVGIVSWGEGCARPGYPGVYSRVNRYITWIEKNTIDACKCSAY